MCRVLQNMVCKKSLSITNVPQKSHRTESRKFLSERQKTQDAVAQINCFLLESEVILAASDLMSMRAYLDR